MSPEHTEDPDPVQPDPLLQPGSFIDPNPAPNGNGTPKPEPKSKPGASTVDPTTATPTTDRPDWLPSDWTLKETVRSSGASAGTKDKYFIEPVTNRRFRSKKEVLLYLETGTPPTQKRKSSDSNVDNKLQAKSQAKSGTPKSQAKSGTPKSQAKSDTPKRKKSEAKAKTAVTTFNWDDVPEKVKWSLTDVYDGSWRPLVNGVDRVPESTKQEWSSAFVYLSMQNGGRATYSNSAPAK